MMKLKTKKPRKKIKNQKNKDQNEKKNIWKIVIEGIFFLKKNFYKKNRNKIRN
jgi:hypothetical protein